MSENLTRVAAVKMNAETLTGDNSTFNNANTEANIINNEITKTPETYGDNYQSFDMLSESLW